MKQCYRDYIAHASKEQSEAISDTHVREAFGIFSSSIEFLSKKRQIEPGQFAQEIQTWLPTTSQAQYLEYIKGLIIEFSRKNSSSRSQAIFAALDTIQELFTDERFYKENFSSLNPAERNILKKKVSMVMTQSIQTISQELLDRADNIAERFSQPTEKFCYLPQPAAVLPTIFSTSKLKKQICWADEIHTADTAPECKTGKEISHSY